MSGELGGGVVVPFAAPAREAINAPIRDAVYEVLRRTRGIYVKRGFVTSIIVKQLADNFPQVTHVTPRRVRYVLNDLERDGRVERVIEHQHRASGNVVPVCRWRVVQGARR